MPGCAPFDGKDSPSCPDPSEFFLDLMFELRTPITSIRGALGLLQAGSFGEVSKQGQQMLDIAFNNTERLMRLITALEDNPRSAVSVMSPEAMARLRLENDLQRALAQKELEVYFQPIYSLLTKKILGFETLLRWRHPIHGIITPDQFISIAEETGLIIPIGAWVLQEACSQLKQWQEQFSQMDALTVSVNLSSKQLSDPSLVEQIHQTLERTGLNPHNLKLEITESSMMENAETATYLLFQLQEAGIQIYIDDFGTGYSSLSRLNELPIDVLKIDRSFVNRMCADTTQIQIIRSIASLAENLGMEIIAEGIETPDQMQQLKGLGCKVGQGYLFSKPVDKETATNLLTNHLLGQ